MDSRISDQDSRNRKDDKKEKFPKRAIFFEWRGHCRKCSHMGARLGKEDERA